MRGNPELALIRSEEQHLARQDMLGSSERRQLNEALTAFANRFGYGDAAAYCCTRATAYTLLANPKSTREARIAAADALFDAGAGA